LWQRYYLMNAAIGKLCYLKFGDKLQEVKVGVVDEVEGLTDDAVYGLLGGLQEAVQPNLHASLRPHRALKVYHLSLHCDVYSTWYCNFHCSGFSGLPDPDPSIDKQKNKGKP
jgi:hypothetical protein